MHKGPRFVLQRWSRISVRICQGKNLHLFSLRLLSGIHIHTLALMHYIQLYKLIMGIIQNVQYWLIRIRSNALFVMQNAVDQPPKFVGRWVGAYTINVFVVVWVLVVGFGFGGWASVTNFVRQIDTFGLFTKCYQCPPPLPPPPHLLNATAPPPLRHPNPHHHSPWFAHVHPLRSAELPPMASHIKSLAT
jgi:hypothetical protein